MKSIMLLTTTGSAGSRPSTTAHHLLSVLTRSARAQKPHRGVRARACMCPAERPLARAATWLRGSGMPRLLCWCLLWFGLLLVRFSLEQSYRSSARKLCGKHLLKGIVKLCGDVDWSHFDDNTPFKKQLVLQAMKKVESFIPDGSESSLTTFQVGGRTHTGKNLNQRRVSLSLCISYPRICSASW